MEDPEWLKIAINELGTKEVVGDKHNPRILEYHKATNLKATTDEVPYCSSFVNWCMKQCGIVGTNSAAARSWLKWGKELKSPEYGCIVILWRKSPDSTSAHVGFWVSETKTHMKILGANQNNMVCYADFNKNRLLGYRWLK
jgi:uncharacterized protein (TIGR02594 family)